MHQILSLRPAATRRMIISQIEKLANVPHTNGDFEVIDSTGRKNQVQVLHGYAITFWADHAVKELRIVDVTRFGRGF
jgi:hypothetical protein